VVVFKELGTTFAQVEQQILVLHFCKSRAHQRRQGVVITHVTLPGPNGWAWPCELPLTGFFFLSKAEKLKAGQLNRLNFSFTSNWYPFQGL